MEESLNLLLEDIESGRTRIRCTRDYRIDEYPTSGHNAYIPDSSERRARVSEHAARVEKELLSGETPHHRGRGEQNLP